MSKIFDALNKAGSETPEVFQRVIQDSAAGQPVSADTTRGAKAHASEMPPKVRELIGDVKPAPVEDRGAAEKSVLALKLGPNSPLLPFNITPNRASEEYRIIRTKIFQHPKRPRLIVVSSAGPADGKTVTAVNLAGVLSLKSDAKVILLDTDFRRSSIAATLGLPATPGLADVLTGRCDLDSVIIGAEQLPNLYIAPAGECLCNPTELLDSAAWRQTCATLRTKFGHIVLDSPPIQAVADYELIQAAADGVVFVVRPDHTKRVSFDAAVKSIPAEKLIGIIINCVSDWFLTKRYHYGYQYDGRPEHSRPKRTGAGVVGR